MNFIIILLILPLTIDAQYEIEVLTNPLLPINQGTSCIVTSHHHIYYHVNLTNIRNCLRKVKTSLRQINSTLLNITTPFKTLLLTRTHDLYDQIKEIKQFIKHYSVSNSTSQRNKRGLFNIIGKAHKYIYGTLDADDGERYDNYITTLRENQNTIQQEISSTQTILKNLTKHTDLLLDDIKENQDKIQQRINELSEITESTKSTMYFTMILDNVENNIRKLSEICINIQTAINFADIGILHYSIINCKDLKNIISQLNIKTRIPFDNIIKYYEIAHTDVIIKNDLIVFYIAIPLISGKPYTLYKIYPIPIQGKIAILQNPYFLSSADEFYNTQEKCPKVEGIILCSRLQLSTNEPCVLNPLNITGHCSLTPIQYNITSITQLSDNSLIIIPSSKEKNHFICPIQETLEVITEPSLILPHQCSIKIKNDYYDSQEIDSVNLRLKLPTIKINKELIQNIKPLQLKEINLDTIHEDLKHVNSLKIQPLKQFEGNATSYIVSIVIIIIIVICVIIMYFYFKKKNVKVNIQLKSLEKGTPFSQT